MAKVPKVHPIYGPRLMHRKRHEYRPLTDEQRADHDHQSVYSFTIQDDKFAADIDEQLFKAQVEDGTFTYKHFQTARNGHIFKVTMHGEVTDDLKKILFKVGLKVGGGIKTR